MFHLVVEIGTSPIIEPMVSCWIFRHREEAFATRLERKQDHEAVKLELFRFLNKNSFFLFFVANFVPYPAILHLTKHTILSISRFLGS